MLKSIFLKTTAIALCATSLVCAGGHMDTHYHKTSYLMGSGSNSYGAEIIESIHANGMVRLNGTTVRGCVEVNGQLNADHADIGSALINGKANLNQCHIQDTTIINGLLVGGNTTFQGDISIASEKIILSSCTASSILIRKIEGNSHHQVVDLRDGTIVYGDIVFESGHGQVMIDMDSGISGSVHGGSIRQY